MSIRYVAAFYGLDWPAVKLIDKRALQSELEGLDFSGTGVGHG